MPTLQHWQASAFAQTLSDLLSLLPTDYLTHLQFQSICNQMNMTFASGSDQTRLAQYFRSRRSIPKEGIFKLVEVVEYRTFHCRPLMYSWRESASSRWPGPRRSGGTQ